MTSRAVISFSYSVFSFVTDEPRSTSVPVGVVLGSPERRWVRLRLVEENERLTGFNMAEHFPFVRLVRDKILHWMETGELPHREAATTPYRDDWWRHVRELLIHRVRLSEPRSIDCHDPETQIEVLYESVVAPRRPPREARTRIEGEIRKCLADLAGRFKGRQALPGYGGRSVKVQRLYEGTSGYVVIEGVNLAGPQPEPQVDATVSKLQRLRKGVERDCRIMVGYLPSPEGLNGEAVLVRWIEEATQAKTFDLLRQREEFRTAADQLVGAADGQQAEFEWSSACAAEAPRQQHLQAGVRE